MFEVRFQIPSVHWENGDKMDADVEHVSSSER